MDTQDNKDKNLIHASGKINAKQIKIGKIGIEAIEPINNILIVGNYIGRSTWQHPWVGSSTGWEQNNKCLYEGMSLRIEETIIGGDHPMSKCNV